MSLALKYRPRTWDEVSGQDQVVSILKNSFRHGSNFPVLLFYGSHGTGKTSVSRIVGATFLCERNSFLPCLECSSCLSIPDSNPRYLEIDAASSRKVEEIKEIRKFSGYAGKKVIVLDEVHMLSRESFGSLLKTLEESDKETIWIMCTTEENKIPTNYIFKVFTICI